MRLALLALLALLLGAAVALVASDLIHRPRDIWLAVTYLAGSLMGWAWGRWQPHG